jgi:hypothetical protein
VSGTVGSGTPSIGSRTSGSHKQLQLVMLKTVASTVPDLADEVSLLGHAYTCKVMLSVPITGAQAPSQPHTVSSQDVPDSFPAGIPTHANWRDAPIL